MSRALKNYLVKIGWLLSVLHFTCYAQEVEVIKDINLGTIVVTNNDTVGVLDLSETGNVTITDHFRIIIPGHPGVIELRDFAWSAELHINAYILQNTTLSDVISPEKFTMTQINVPNSIITEEDGSAEIYFGAQISTSGSGSKRYADTTFSSQIKFAFQY
jgi:hypothetical protein